MDKYATLISEVRANPFAKGKLDESDFTSKKIDEFIHLPNWDKDYSCNHQEHQEKIIEVISGREKEIFNDASYVYPGRDNPLSGETGRISAILRSCYFHLFHYLLNPKFNININPLYTQNILMNILLQIDFDYTAKKSMIPQAEFEDIQYILRYLREKYGTTLPLFKEETWKALRTKIREKKAFIETKEFWKTKTEPFKWDILVGNYLSDIFPYGGYDYDLWEYVPCYFITYTKDESRAKSYIHYDESEALLDFVQCMFLSTSTCENKDTTCYTKSCRRGGKRKTKKVKKNKKTKKSKRRTA